MARTSFLCCVSSVCVVRILVTVIILYIVIFGKKLKTKNNDSFSFDFHVMFVCFT